MNLMNDLKQLAKVSDSIVYNNCWTFSEFDENWVDCDEYWNNWGKVETVSVVWSESRVTRERSPFYFSRLSKSLQLFHIWFHKTEAEFPWKFSVSWNRREFVGLTQATQISNTTHLNKIQLNKIIKRVKTANRMLKLCVYLVGHRAAGWALQKSRVQLSEHLWTDKLFLLNTLKMRVY